MGNRFRHVLCLACYAAVEPGARKTGREPMPVSDTVSELCCRCGAETLTPVYYRAEPERFRCRGIHEPG